MEVINAIGRRKSAIARVYLSEGKGNITVNSRKIDDYFTARHFYDSAVSALKVTENLEKFDIKMNIAGGGIKGQADAARLGIARALLKIDPEYRTVLKPLGMLTRDSRVVERKKPGQPKARKKFQFSKR